MSHSSSFFIREINHISTRSILLDSVDVNFAPVDDLRRLGVSPRGTPVVLLHSLIVVTDDCEDLYRRIYVASFARGVLSFHRALREILQRGRKGRREKDRSTMTANQQTILIDARVDHEGGNLCESERIHARLLIRYFYEVLVTP